MRRADLDWARLALLATCFAGSSMGSWATGRPPGDEWALALLSGRLPRVWELCAVGLLLIISGGAIRRSLERIAPGTFVLRKVFRLFVPVIFGALVLSPAQAYLELRRSGARRLPLIPFLSGMLEGPQLFTPHGFHLAYLLLLFALSLLFLPLFLIARRHAPAFSAPALIVLAAALLPPASFAAWGAAGALVAAPIVLAGGFLCLDGALVERSLAAICPWLLAAGAASTPFAFVAPGAVGAAIGASGAWISAFALLGLALRPLDRMGAPPVRLRECGLPFFLLSRPVTLWLAYLLQGLALPPAISILIVTLLAAALLAGASLLVRRSNPLRFLTGLRPLPTPLQPPRAPWRDSA